MTALRPGAFDAAVFLRDDWQRRPRLFRNPWTAWQNPLDPDDLAGLACEEGVAARIVRQGRRKLRVEHGPFTAARFARPGKRPWTLLVQGVDRMVPAVAHFRDAFAFVPSWRIDDVMVSYAVDGGGVGAHFDNYDVFLVQGLGQRRWQVGGRCDAATPLLPHDDLRLLAAFEATGDWLLEPGDMLYVPPGVAHHGIAVGDDCMTYSVGFRAPSRADLLAGWCDALLDGMTEDDRFADPGLAPAANPGEIAPDAIAALHAMVTTAVGDRTAFARWFGRSNTASRLADADTPNEVPPPADLATRVASAILYRNPASRFAFVRGGAGVVLFADGAAFDCAGAAARLAESLCARDRVAVSARPTRAVLALIASLLAQDSVSFEPWDDLLRREDSDAHPVEHLHP